MSDTTETIARLREQIKSYLVSGGLFNPEMMEHEKVRDLILECRALCDAYEASQRVVSAAKRISRSIHNFHSDQCKCDDCTLLESLAALEQSTTGERGGDEHSADCYSNQLAGENAQLRQQLADMTNATAERCSQLAVQRIIDERDTLRQRCEQLKKMVQSIADYKVGSFCSSYLATLTMRDNAKQALTALDEKGK